MKRTYVLAHWALVGIVLGSGFVACGNGNDSASGDVTNAGGTAFGGKAGQGGTKGPTTGGSSQTTGEGGISTSLSTTGGALAQSGANSGGSVGVGGRNAGGMTPNAGGLSNGGAPTGGAPTGGAGASTGGKSATGGATTGGAPSGGAQTAGGKSGVGGAATGGAPIGGTTTAGGKSATGGAATGGKSSTGGAATGGSATGGTTSSAGLSCSSTLPAYTSSTTVSSTITISGTKDYAMQRLCADPNTLGPGDQTEDQKPVIMMSKGAVLKNVIIGGSGCSAADGVHCESGSCTLENVWFGDVGEDAISFKGSDSSQVMTITGGGAFEASDKVIQHNGPGTIKVDGFFVKNAGKLYRSCGNCSTQYARHVELTNVYASGVSTLVGINTNYGDTATINSLTKCGSVSTVCQTFTGNSSGDEPTSLQKYSSSGDGQYCKFTAANIH
jgi:pectate lyase